MPRWNYQSANEFLVGRRKLHGNIASYTYLERDQDMIVMKFGQFKHGGKEIVRLHPDGRIVFTACWKCPSVMDRMNLCLRPYNVFIMNDRGYWCIHKRLTPHLTAGVKQSVLYSFKDGITLHPDGTVTNYDPEPFDQKIKNHLAAIRKRNAIHVVESAKGFTVGDVVSHETQHYDFTAKQGYSYALVKKTHGPFRITKIKASMNRAVLWLKNLDGSPIMADGNTAAQYQGVSMRYNRFRRDKFLSAVSQASRNPVTAVKIRAILDFSNLSTCETFMQRLASDVELIPQVGLAKQ